MKVWTPIGGALCMGLLVAGCGSSGTTASSGGTAAGGSSSTAPSTSSTTAATNTSATASVGGALAPCSLMTPADIQAQFGGTVSSGMVDAEITAGPTCTFQITGSSLGSGVQAFARISDEAPGAWMVGEPQLVSSGSAVAVPGIGQAAYYSEGQQAVTFLEGGKVFDVQIVSGILDDADTFAASPAKYKAAILALTTAVANRV